MAKLNPAVAELNPAVAKPNPAVAELNPAMAELISAVAEAVIPREVQTFVRSFSINELRKFRSLGDVGLMEIQHPQSQPSLPDGIVEVCGGAPRPGAGLPPDRCRLVPVEWGAPRPAANLPLAANLLPPAGQRSPPPLTRGKVARLASSNNACCAEPLPSDQGKICPSYVFPLPILDCLVFSFLFPPESLTTN